MDSIVVVLCEQIVNGVRFAHFKYKKSKRGWLALVLDARDWFFKFMVSLNLESVLTLGTPSDLGHAKIILRAN